MEESDQHTLKEQLSVLFAILFPSEFPRYRAMDAVNMPQTKNLLQNGMDARHRVPINSLKLTTYTRTTVPPETRREGKHRHLHERSFISKTALNFDRLFAEHTEHIKQESLKERCYAPEYIILQALQTYSLHVSRLLYAAEQNLVKNCTFDVVKGDHNTDPASFFSHAPHGIDSSSSSSYFSQLIPTLQLPYGQTLQFSLSHSTPSIATLFLILPCYHTFILPLFLL